MEIDEFINNALQRKPADCRINISKFQSVYKALGEGLKGQGVPTSEIVDMRWLNLQGLCPECGGLIFGSDLGKLFMIRVDAEEGGGWDHIHIRGLGRSLRFFKEGLCVNESCSSTEIILSWRPCYEWLKDRKGRILSSEEIATYAQAATAIAETIDIQESLDDLFKEVESNILEVSL